MKTDIFKSIKTSNRYFLIPSGSDIHIIPEKVEQKMWKSIDLKEGENRIAIAGSEAIRGIKEKGYYEVNADLTFNLK